MAKTFLLPDIGEGLTDAEIVEWSVAVGDLVEEGTLLCEIETAKAVVEMTAPWPGVVLHLGGEPGDTIAVGSALVVIGDSGETWSPDADTSAESTVSSAPPTSLPGSEAAEPSVKAMPVVRRLAAELGVDLAAVTASGPGGRVTRDDVQGAAGHVVGVADERVPLSRLRRTIASHMSKSWDEIPHVTTFDDINVKALVDLRSALAADGRAVSLEALLVRAVLPALVAHPEFNATLDDEVLVLHRRYDIGVAVDTPGGLVVPVLHSADQLDLAGLGNAIEDLSTRARSRKLDPAELAGGTFTVSNIGALGGGHGTPIIPTGTTAIVSFGRAIDQATVVDGVIAIAPIMPLSLSYDHRVIDGGLGRRFVDHLVTAMGDIDLLQSR